MGTPPELNCNEVVEIITASLEHALPPEQEALLQAHISECNECAIYVEQMRRTIDVLHHMQPAVVAPDIRDHLLAAFQGQR